MALIDDILQYGTVAIAGLEKNTGKTECINYLIRQLSCRPIKAAITSIGMDGEETDQVTGTEKPTIELPAGFVFATSEKHFKERKLNAEILDVSPWRTATGRIVTARVVHSGQIILSGPVQTARMKELVGQFKATHGCDMVLIDGALSRTSQAAPQIADGMILCTGAALSAYMRQVVKQTAHICSLIALEAATQAAITATGNLGRGVWAINSLYEPTLLTPGNQDVAEVDFSKQEGACFYVAGALTDRLVKHILQTVHHPIELIVHDFTKIFTSNEILQLFISKENKLKVLKKNHLIGVCINPWSPQGYHFDATQFEKAMAKAIEAPVYNIRNL